MKASVQYNDFRGTAAADLSDFIDNNLQHYLETTFESYDAEKFHCIGCTAFIGDTNKVSVGFICVDQQTGAPFRFTTQNHWPLEEFFNLFKRFEVVMGRHDLESIEIDENESIYLD